jgi:hypothetical protein
MPRSRSILIPLLLAACIFAPAAAQRDTLPACHAAEDFDALWTYVRDNYAYFTASRRTGTACACSTAPAPRRSRPGASCWRCWKR